MAVTTRAKAPSTPTAKATQGDEVAFAEPAFFVNSVHFAVADDIVRITHVERAQGKSFARASVVMRLKSARSFAKGLLEAIEEVEGKNSDQVGADG